MDPEEVLAKLIFSGATPELGVAENDAIGGEGGGEKVMVFDVEFDPPGPVTVRVTV